MLIIYIIFNHYFQNHRANSKKQAENEDDLADLDKRFTKPQHRQYLSYEVLYSIGLIIYISILSWLRWHFVWLYSVDTLPYGYKSSLWLYACSVVIYSVGGYSPVAWLYACNVVICVTYGYMYMAYG